MKGTYTSLAALAAVANARNLAMPAITGTVVLPLDGFSPMPTAPPGLHELMRRANSESSELETVYLAPDNTCGYVSGRPGAGYTCFGTSVTCVFFTSASTRNSGAIACCDDLSCNLRVSCIDYNGYYSSSQCDDGCQVDAYTLKCTDSAMPYCNTISFSGGIQDFWCNAVDISTAQLASTTYRGETDSRSLSPLVLTDTSSLIVTSEDIGAGPSATGNIVTVTAGSDGSSSSSGSDKDSSSKSGGGGSKTPIGAIVGGVVGGVAAIGLLGLALFFILRRKKKQSPDQAPPMQQQQQPPPGNAPPGYVPPQQPIYDPKPQPYPSPSPSQQYTQPAPAGGFYPVQGHQPSPDATSPSSPTVSYMTDPRLSQPPISPSPSHAGSAVPSTQQQGGFQPQQGTIHEAGTSPADHHRGEMHELA